MYLVPANTKKANLILGFMRPVDVIIASVGITITIILMLVIGNNNSTLIVLLGCTPAILGAILILPIPNYHNTLVAIQSIFNYYNQRRSYIWKGWCIYDEYKD